MARIDKVLSWLIIYLIKIYQYTLRPFIGYDCRFYPTCSCYSTEAIQIYGIWKGLILSLRRILCCHPWHPGGIDNLPFKKVNTMLEKTLEYLQNCFIYGTC